MYIGRIAINNMEELAENIPTSMIKHGGYIDWNEVAKHFQLSELFIMTYIDKFDKRLLSEHQVLPEYIIRKYKDDVNWNSVSLYNSTLTKKFIREFQDKVNWDFISFSQILGESFIEEFKDKVNWKWISTKQCLTEDFIRKFEDRVDWKAISANQILSNEFIKEFVSKLDRKLLLKNKSSEDFDGETLNTIIWYPNSLN